jgi:hypothetical protein
LRTFLPLVQLAWIAGLFLLGCGERIVVADGSRDASTPDSQDVVDAAITDWSDSVDAMVTDSRDAAFEDIGLPPFSIPDAPRTGSLRPCGTMSEPMPVGFLPDGRALIAQSIGSSQMLIRAWDPATNGLEDIFATESAHVTMSQNGDRLIVDGGGLFRIFDLGQRRFVTDAPVPGTIASVSGDGQFVIDNDLVRRKATGAEPFDFAALLPPGLHFIPGMIALSPSGDAVAVALFNREAIAVVLAVVYQDGRVVLLPPGPDSDLKQLSCVGECGFRWSGDGRRLLSFSPFLLLRVWDVDKNSLLVAEEPGVQSASFLPNGTSMITVAVADGAIVERDLLAGGPTFTWGTVRNNGRRFLPAFDVAGNRLLFAGNRPGDPGYGLALATRDGRGAYWRHSVPAYDNSGLALAGNALFALLQAWDPPVELFQVMIGRYAVGGGPPTDVVDPSLADERQSEWQGQVVVSPDEQRVAAILPDSVRVVDAASLAPLATIRVAAGMVAWSPDGRYLALTPDVHYRDTGRPPLLPRADVVLWDSLSGGTPTRFPAPVVPVKIAFDDQGKKIVGWGYSLPDKRGDRISFDVDLATGRSLLSPMLPFVGATRELVATSTSIMRVSTGEVVSSLAAPLIDSAVFSGDGSMLLGLSGNPDSALSLQLFGVKDGHLIATVPGDWFQQGRPPAFALSRDGRRVALGTPSGAAIYCLDEPP